MPTKIEWNEGAEEEVSINKCEYCENTFSVLTETGDETYTFCPFCGVQNLKYIDVDVIRIQRPNPIHIPGSKTHHEFPE